MKTFNCFRNLTLLFFADELLETDERKHDRNIAHEPMLTAAMKRKTDRRVKRNVFLASSRRDGDK
jgi:hypothetical protein